MFVCGTHDSDMMCHARTYWQRRPITPIVEVSYKRPGSGGQQSQTRHVSVCQLGAIPFTFPPSHVSTPHGPCQHCRTRSPNPFLPFRAHNKHSYKATHADDFHSQNMMRTYVAFLFLLLRVSEGMTETRNLMVADVGRGVWPILVVITATRMFTDGTLVGPCSHVKRVASPSQVTEHHKHPLSFGHCPSVRGGEYLDIEIGHSRVEWSG